MIEPTAGVPGRRPTTVRTLLAALAVALMLAGCGPVEVRTAPPGSDLEGVRVVGDAVVLRIIVVNRNDVPLQVTGAELDVTLADEALPTRDWPLALDIGPRNREAVELRLPVTDGILAAFDALERGDRAPLSYELAGRWALDGSRDGRIQRSGFLHPVPGRPGRFR